jgi:hypothetical protein
MKHLIRWPVVHFTTWETQLRLPEALYHSPNCRFFNWQVKLMRRTGVSGDGQPTAEPVSHPSLYWYIWWLHPPGRGGVPGAMPLCALRLTCLEVGRWTSS